VLWCTTICSLLLCNLWLRAADVKVHDVADEYSIYQKLPTFFYEYMPRRKKRD
jgi:hypothetical protein